MLADTWSTLQFLFSRPWFSRLWVINEAAVAKEFEVFCGTLKRLVNIAAV
jgi:hypothetical protein